MAIISHFIVTYNHETNEWELDSESQQVLGGNIFDTVSEEWSNPDAHTIEEFVDSKAANILYTAVNNLSKVEE